MLIWEVQKEYIEVETLKKELMRRYKIYIEASENALTSTMRIKYAWKAQEISSLMEWLNKVPWQTIANR